MLVYQRVSWAKASDISEIFLLGHGIREGTYFLLSGLNVTKVSAAPREWQLVSNHQEERRTTGNIVPSQPAAHQGYLLEVSGGWLYWGHEGKRSPKLH